MARIASQHGQPVNGCRRGDRDIFKARIAAGGAGDIEQPSSFLGNVEVDRQEPRPPIVPDGGPPFGKDLSLVGRTCPAGLVDARQNFSMRNDGEPEAVCVGLDPCSQLLVRSRAPFRRRDG
jgi:hypothetical protein